MTTWSARLSGAGFIVSASTSGPLRPRWSSRIRAAELLHIAGEVQRPLEQLTGLDLGQVPTPGLERLLPLLLNLTDLVHGAGAAADIVARLAEQPSADPRHRALIMAMASDLTYGIRGDRRQAAIEAIGTAEAVGHDADASLHRALINLADIKVNAAEGLDHGLLDRAAQLEGRFTWTSCGTWLT